MTVLYDLEYISGGLAMSYAHISHGYYIGRMRQFRTWSYSAWNVYLLAREHNVYAQHCPLGFTHELVVPAQHAAPTEDIHVLFYGNFIGAGTHRLKILEEVGEVARHTIKAYDLSLFGPRLQETIMQAKVILVLSQGWGFGEFKMTRLAPLLANKR